jgi:DNA helicase HerA-like ATPase
MGEKMGYNVIITDLTQAEKTRIIVERIFSILMKLGVSSDKKARVLIIFEEAHSLMPAWNSVSNEGDKTAANGTAKIILQGRKYGLGCFVITQRTANVSKSILNQCNTIFAMRVFDDTGKGFLENYIGTDYTNTLPTLEERNAIVIGKGLQLKRPVIIELNDKKYIVSENIEQEIISETQGRAPE